MRGLVEKLVDVKRLLCAQHDVQKNAAKTDVLRLSKRKREQIDYILTKRRYLRNVKDAEANDMIHMGSDHRCIMAAFLINTPDKKTNVRRENKKHEMNVYVEHKKKAKNTNIEMSDLEERYQEIVRERSSRKRERRRSSRSRKHTCRSCSTRD